MARHVIRALLPCDTSAFAAFERDNREAYERFNEPHPEDFYSDAGLQQAFNRLLARQVPERYVTRITTGVDPARWVGKGSLTVHNTDEGAFAMLVYQTDRLHWRQGAARPTQPPEHRRRVRCLPRAGAGAEGRVAWRGA